MALWRFDLDDNLRYYSQRVPDFMSWETDFKHICTSAPKKAGDVAPSHNVS